MRKVPCMASGCIALLLLTASAPTAAVPLQAVSFTNAAVNGVYIGISAHSPIQCALRLDGDAGDPANAPGRTPASRIDFSASVQCVNRSVFLHMDTWTSGTLDTYDANDGLTKRLLGLELERMGASTSLPATSVASATVPPATTASFVTARGTYSSQTLDTAVFRIKAVLRLTDDDIYHKSVWLAVAASANSSGDCQNVEETAETITLDHAVQYLTPLPNSTGDVHDWPYLYGAAIQCTVYSPYFNLADIDGRHFLASASKFYTACSFNSRRATASAAHLNYLPTGAGGPVSPRSSAVFTDPSAQCTRDDWVTWDTVPIKFDFSKSGIDPCGSQHVADTQVLTGYVQIAGGPQIPAKMLVRVTPLGPFDPIVNVEIVNNFSFDTPLSQTPTGQYLDAPASQAPILNDEAESIANLYSFFTPTIAPAFGSNIYSVKVDAADKGTVLPIAANLVSIPTPPQSDPNTLACDRRELRFDFAGTLQEPGSREDEVSLGSGLYVPVAATPAELDATYQATGQAIDAATAGNLISGLGSLADVLKGLPKLPFSPPVPYTITVEYLNPIYPAVCPGQTSATTRCKLTVAGAFGVPTPVFVPAAQPAAFVVTLGTTNQLASVKALTQTDGGDYMLRIQKVQRPSLVQAVVPAAPALSPLAQLTSSCASPTPVNITINLGLKDLGSLVGLPTSSLNPVLDSVNATAVSIGYKALGVGATSSPNDFALVFQQHGDAGFSVHEGVVPCVSTDPLSIEASYTNGNGQGTEIKAAAEMTPAVESFAFSSLTDNQDVRRLTYTGSSPMKRFSASGIDSGTRFEVGLGGLTNASVCQHKGKLCNVGWRRHKKSGISFNFKSWGNDGNYAPVDVYVYTAPSSSLPSVFDVRLASFAGDAKVDGMDEAFTNFGGYGLLLDAVQVAGEGGQNYFDDIKFAYDLYKSLTSDADFPFWAYVGTDRQTVSGAVSTPAMSFTAESGFWTTNRELKLVRYWLFVWLHTHGRASCGDLDFTVVRGSTTGAGVLHAGDGTYIPYYYELPEGALNGLLKDAFCSW